MLRKIAILLLLSLPAFSLYKEGEVLVKFKEGVSSKSIQSKAANILSIEPLFETTYKIRFSKGSVEDMMATLKSESDVVYAEPNYIRHICGTPNDPSFTSQWGLPKIQAPLAWDIGTGAGFVKIAIIDTGVDIDHPDLVEKIISGGYDFANDDSNPDDDQGHGTHVAGIAAASTNNWIGVAGVAWGCKILAVKTFNKEGKGDDADCAEGIIYAAENGARVINMSFGETGYSITLKNACDYAYNEGCLLVAAAGNDGTNVKFYPAAYDNVMAIAATNQFDQRAYFSNYGDWVDVAAPGDDIYSTKIYNAYGNMSGTSMATPFVSGLAGLLFSGSGSLTNVQATGIIKATADVIYPDHPIGTGRINVYNAIRQVKPPQIKTWTFMVYLDGDNNLETEAIKDFIEMASVGSTDTVNIVVQFDRISGYNTGHGNWTGTKRFYITKGMTPISGSATMSIGEANMGDPQTLIDFVQWTKFNYPAEKYALVLWNHGGGWRSKEMTTKAVCEDDTSNDCLYMKEVSLALSQVEKIDLIGFDACLMAMVEVAYEIQDFGDVMVGSEESEPWDGWPYNTILAELVGSPTMTARSLSRIIVERYGQSYPYNQSDITQSAIDLKLMGSFTQSIDSMVANIWGRWDEIEQKRAITDSVYNASYADIFHFSQLMNATLTVNPVISNYHSPDHPKLQGLTIYFPETDDDSEYEDYTADNISFPAHCQWDEFLKELLNPSLSYFVIEASSTTYTDATFTITIYPKDKYGNPICSMGTITLDNLTHSITPKTYTLTGTKTLLIATILTSPNGGTDTITVSKGSIISQKGISVLLDDTKSSQVIANVTAGTITVSLEANALGTSSYISITPLSILPERLPSGLMGPADSRYEITARDTIGTELGTVSGTVTISFPYLDKNGDGFVDGTSVREENLRVLCYDGNNWGFLTSTTYLATRTITAIINHFSPFVLAGTGSFSLSLGDVIAYPNPYYPSKGHTKITFGGDRVPIENRLTKNATIRIYSIAGELVKEIPESDGDGEAIWEHPEVASGVYIYLIQSPGGKKDIGKIGIVK